MLSRNRGGTADSPLGQGDIRAPKLCFRVIGGRTLAHESLQSPATLRRVLAARGLRAFGDGYISLLLPVYLLSQGYSAFDVGVIATATLLGSGALTLALGLVAHRFRTRTLLLGAAAMMTATGFAFATVGGFWPLVVVALVGTLNPSSSDVSVFLPLEHTTLARVAPERTRTSWFARYSLVGALLGAGGAIAAGLPQWIASTGVAMPTALRAMFVLYALLGVACAFVYAGLPAVPRDAIEGIAAPLRSSRRVVMTLAALFSLDAFAGGLIVQSLLALWLLHRFHLSIATAGVIFFWTGVVSALSYVAAVRIADRFGLVNTMVFTHLPSSVLLMLVPFAPDLATCIGLLLARSALSQMDVPTRSAFVMSVVPPGERAAAASVTAVSRSLASAAGPLVAGYLLTFSGFGWPLLAAGALKIGYDLLLLRFCRSLPPL